MSGPKTTKGSPKASSPETQNTPSEFDIEAELELMREESEVTDDANTTQSEDPDYDASFFGEEEEESTGRGSGYESRPVDVDRGVKPDDVEIKDRWSNRRRMAWIAFMSIIVVTLITMFVLPIDRIKALEPILTWFFGVMASIVGSYFGFTTFYHLQDDKNKRRNNGSS